MYLQTTPGRSAPLGATVVEGGVNFSVFSRNAAAVELLFFDREDDSRPVRSIPLDPETNRTYHYWHTFVPEVQPGQIYGYRVQGRFDPLSGTRFDGAKILLDPYGRGVVVPKNYSREAGWRPGDNSASAMKRVIVDPLLTIGRVIRLSDTRQRERSFMRCTFAALRTIRVHGSRTICVAPTPA